MPNQRVAVKQRQGLVTSGGVLQYQNLGCEIASRRAGKVLGLLDKNMRAKLFL